MPPSVTYRAVNELQGSLLYKTNIRAGSFEDYDDAGDGVLMVVVVRLVMQQWLSVCVRAWFRSGIGWGESEEGGGACDNGLIRRSVHSKKRGGFFSSTDGTRV